AAFSQPVRLGWDSWLWEGITRPKLIPRCRRLVAKPRVPFGRGGFGHAALSLAARRRRSRCARTLPSRRPGERRAASPARGPRALLPAAPSATGGPSPLVVARPPPAAMALYPRPRPARDRHPLAPHGLATLLD